MESPTFRMLQELFQHYTDSHGYTEINFAAFAMLGLRFCPRIRGVQHQRIYRIDPNCDHGSLASLVSRADQTIDTEQIAEQWDRMGQLYASLKTGHVTASVALKRLVGFSAKNRFHRANRDLGRIFKTEFILPCLSEPELRRRIRRGLLKFEQLHALARDVFHEAAMAMRFHAKINDFIDLLHVYPTMAEALKIVAISRRKDPAKLSGCAE